jgi:hypothetical protein
MGCKQSKIKIPEPITPASPDFTGNQLSASTRSSVGTNFPTRHGSQHLTPPIQVESVSTSPTLSPLLHSIPAAVLDIIPNSTSNRIAMPPNSVKDLLKNMPPLAAPSTRFGIESDDKSDGEFEGGTPRLVCVPKSPIPTTTTSPVLNQRSTIPGIVSATINSCVREESKSLHILSEKLILSDVMQIHSTTNKQLPLIDNVVSVEKGTLETSFIVDGHEISKVIVKKISFKWIAYHKLLLWVMREIIILVYGVLMRRDYMSRLIALGDDNEYIIFVFEQGYVDLHEFLQLEKQLTQYEAKVIMLKIINAVDKMHSDKIMHRDIKTMNILIARTEFDFSVIICDFGHATLSPISDEFCGTQTWMADEIGKRSYTNKVDIWGIGKIAYVFYKKIKMNGEVKEFFTNIIQHTMRKDMDERPTIRELISSLPPSALCLECPMVTVPVINRVSSFDYIDTESLTDDDTNINININALKRYYKDHPMPVESVNNIKSYLWQFMMWIDEKCIC